MQQYILANPCNEDDPMRPWTLQHAPEKSREEVQPTAGTGAQFAGPFTLLDQRET